MTETAEVKIDELESALAGKIGGGDEEDKPVDPPVDDKKEPEAPKEESPSELDQLKQSNEEMRQMLLDQKRQNARLESRLNRLSRPKTVEKEPVEDDDDDEVKPKAKTEAKPSEIETLESEVKALHDSKDSIFDMQLDVMSESKRYSDVLDVCSDSNISDIMDAATKQVAKDQNMDYHAASLSVEKFVWSQKNPYKYLYGLIKEYHPKFVKKAGQDASTADKTDKGKEKEKPKAPSSIASVQDDGKVKGGWSSAKIDAMPEGELHKVPRDIYEKYLANQLD